MSALRRPAALAALLALGCSTALPRQPVPGREEGDWAEARHRFTRSTKVYDRFDDKAFATATYQALPVRLARAARIAEWKRMTVKEREALLAEERAEAEKYDDFLLAFFVGADFAANDLDAPRSVWRVALVVPGEGEALPVQIRQVRQDSDLTGLYPYIGHFDVVYRVRFARWAGQKPLAELPFVLRIAGALGKVDLDWGKTPGEPRPR
jgi:hypothetical protein